MEAFSKNPFESVEARIINGEGKVMGVMGGVEGGVGVMESSG